MHDLGVQIKALRDAIDAIDTRDPMGAIDRITLWQDVRLVRMDLDIVYRDVEHDATIALVELLRDSGDDTLETPLGAVHIGIRRPNAKWEGHRLLGALAQNVVGAGDPERKVYPAVDLGVLRDVIQGCANEDLTSANFRVGALKKYVDVTRYVDRGAPEEIIRDGMPR